LHFPHEPLEPFFAGEVVVGFTADFPSADEVEDVEAVRLSPEEATVTAEAVEAIGLTPEEATIIRGSFDKSFLDGEV